MKDRFRTIDTSTLKGLKQAERLHATGWKMRQTGLFRIQFERKRNTEPHCHQHKRFDPGCSLCFTLEERSHLHADKKACFNHKLHDDRCAQCRKAEAGQ